MYKRQPETKPIFTTRAKELNAPIYFAEEEQLLHSSSINEKGKRIDVYKRQTLCPNELLVSG